MKPKILIPLDQIDWVNKNDSKIAAEIGVSRERIRQIRKTNNFPKSKLFNRNNYFLDICQVLSNIPQIEWKKYSCRDIGKKYNISSPVVQKYSRENKKPKFWLYKMAQYYKDINWDASLLDLQKQLNASSIIAACSTRRRIAKRFLNVKSLVGDPELYKKLNKKIKSVANAYSAS